MIHRKHHYALSALLVAAVGVAYATPPASEPNTIVRSPKMEKDVDMNAAVDNPTPPVIHFVNNTDFLSTGFEAADGWDAGFHICGSEFAYAAAPDGPGGATCHYPITNVCLPKNHDANQNCCQFDPNEDTGWFVNVNDRHCRQPSISTAHPSTGTQHMRFEYDPLGGTPAGCQGFASTCRQRVISPEARNPGQQNLGNKMTLSYEMAMSQAIGNAKITRGFVGVDVRALGLFLDLYIYWYYNGQAYLYTVEDGFTARVPFAYWSYDVPDYAKATIILDRCNKTVTYEYRGKPNAIYPTGISTYSETASQPIFSVPYGDFNGPDSHWPIVDVSVMSHAHYNDGGTWDMDNFVLTFEDCPDACCNGDTGACTEGMTETECAASGPFTHYYPNVSCAQLGTPNYPPACVPDLGSCCNTGPGAGGPGPDGACSEVAASACQGTQRVWTRGGSCEGTLSTCNVGGGYCANSAALGVAAQFPAPYCMTLPGYVPCATDADCSVQGFCRPGLCANAVCSNNTATVCDDNADCVAPGVCTLVACGTTSGPGTNATCPGASAPCVIPAVNPGGRLCTSNAQCISEAVTCLETQGACCNTLDGTCESPKLSADCSGAQRVWTKGGTCATVDCDATLGACCDHDTFGGCTNTTNAGCPVGPDNKLEWTKGSSCAAITDCDHNAIPTVSQWGLVVLTLLLLTGAKVYFGRRQASAA